MTSLKDLLGVTLKSVIGEKGGEEIIFEATDGRRWRLFHRQDCCEHVSVEEIVGDLQDLVGSPVLQADESTNVNALLEPPPHVESCTWTFYWFATIKGSVCIRWFGESNGYYSESIDFELIT